MSHGASMPCMMPRFDHACAAADADTPSQNAWPASGVDLSGSAFPDAEEHGDASARRFGGIARLYGAAGLHHFMQARVVVIGIGGVGSWAAEALARSGVGALTLVDLDVIAESNINRQIHALDSDFGRAKVEAMAARIAAFAPQCRVAAIDEFLDADNCARLVAGADAVLDCIDDVRAKAALCAHCAQAGQPLIVCGAAGGKRDATRIRIADLALVRNDPLLARVRTRLRREYGFPGGGGKGRPARFGISGVYCDEPPAAAPGPCAPGSALACAGYGSAMHMTASMGLAAVGVLLDGLAAGVMAQRGPDRGHCVDLERETS